SCWIIVEGLQAGADNPPNPCLATKSDFGDILEVVNSSPAVDKMSRMELATFFGFAGASIIMDFLVGMVVLVQVVLLGFRTMAIAILVGVSQVAAAGAVMRGTSRWVWKILAWLLALVFYKPVAATVYATGFMFLGLADGVTAQIISIMTLLLSLVALPALMKFFDWPVGALESGAGSGLV